MSTTTSRPAMPDAKASALVADQSATVGQMFRQVVNAAPRFRGFYHFTDERNLPSIRRNGLLSKTELARRGIGYVASGSAQSHDSDRRSGVADWISLGFTDMHPMSYVAQSEGRIRNVAWLRIDPIVLDELTTVFCPVMANRKDAEFHDIMDFIHLGQFDAHVLYSYMNWSDPSVRERLEVVKKYELLVRDRVSPDYIWGF